MVTYEIQPGITATTSEPLCTTCYAEPVVAASGTTLGGRCLDLAVAWEVYQDRVGIKPRHLSEDELIEWLRGH